MDCRPPGSFLHGDSLGKNTGVGCHVLFQGTFPTQGLKPHLFCRLHWQAGSLPRAPPEGTNNLKAVVWWLRTAGWNSPRADPCHRPAAEDTAAPANALALPGPSALERLPVPHSSPRGRAGTLEREVRTRGGKELPGALPRKRAPSPDSRRGGGNKADLNCMDCKTATMKVIGEIFMYHSYCDFRMEAL